MLVSHDTETNEKNTHLQFGH